MKDRADAYENRLVAAFEADHSIKRTDDDLSTPEGDFAVTAYPVAVTEPGCLRCHSTPAAAPPQRVAVYGRAGFGWKMNQVVAATVAYVPKQGARAGASGVTRFVLPAIVLMIVVAMAMIDPGLSIG